MGDEVAPHIERLKPYVPGMSVAELARRYGVRDAIKLASNENPLGPSPLALEAAQRALVDIHRYPDGHALRERLAAHHGVAPGEVVIGNGSDELIHLIARTFARPGDTAVYPEPSFPTYAIVATGNELRARVVPLRGHVEYDLEEMLAAVRGDVRLFFLANPNNPTGAHLAGAGLARLLRALPTQAVAVLDEAYVEFADAPDFVSGLALRELHERTLVLRTFSKAYGLAGLRVGYGIGPAALISYLERVRMPFNVNAVALAAAQAALADGAHLARYILHNQRERARVREGLGALSFEVAPSQANFLLARVAAGGSRATADAHVPLAGAALVDALMRRGVITRPMPGLLADWLRITIGTEAENARLLATLGGLLAAQET